MVSTTGLSSNHPSRCETIAADEKRLSTATCATSGQSIEVPSRCVADPARGARSPSYALVVPLHSRARCAVRVFVVRHQPECDSTPRNREFVTLFACQLARGSPVLALQRSASAPRASPRLYRREDHILPNVLPQFPDAADPDALSPRGLARRSPTCPRAARRGCRGRTARGLRLQHLVTTMLDFSRIEAGRATARFEPGRSCALTADPPVCSALRRESGAPLPGRLPASGQAVLVDRRMW